MKLNHRCLFVSGLLFALNIHICPAQSYNGGDTIRRVDFTYVVEKEGPFITLRDVNNTLTHVEQRKKNGDPVEHSIFENNGPRYYSEPHNNDVIFHNLINIAFRPADQEKTRDDYLAVSVFLDSDTGLVTEVNFRFNKDRNGFARIMPERYYHLEQLIRRCICVEPNTLGRSYNYNLRLFFYNGMKFGLPPLDPSLFN